MRRHWTRSHGLGNDYLVIEPAALPTGVRLTPATARLICDRHRGVGGDGILELLTAPSGPDHFAVRIWNPDGSVAEKSGNGLRIVAKYLAEHGHAPGDRFTIVTTGGAAEARVAREPATGHVGAVTIDMGAPSFDPRTTLTVDGHDCAVTILALGNPHCVVLVPDLATVPLEVLGPAIERHPAFPQRTNVQFTTPIDRGQVRAIVWERGAGVTLASGSSACAVAAACQRLGLADAAVLIAMPGGELRVRRDEHGHLWLTGAVEEIVFSADLLAHLRRLSAPERCRILMQIMLSRIPWAMSLFPVQGPTMSTITTALTAEAFWLLPETTKRRSLIRGEVVERMPPGGRHGVIATAFSLRLGTWAAQQGAGIVGTASGFILARDPDVVRGPDVYFIRAERIPEGGIPEAFWNLAPDLVVEIVFPSETAEDVREKVRDFLAAGTALIWVVYARTREAIAHTPDGLARTFHEGDLLRDTALLPGFAHTVAEFFS